MGPFRDEFPRIQLSQGGGYNSLRFYSLEKIENPFLVFIVGLVGLGVNLIGLVLFAGHGHHHHGHSHAHSHRTKDSIPTPELVEGLPMRGANAYVLKDGTEVLADLSEDQCEQEYCEEEMRSKNGSYHAQKAAVQKATPENPVIVSVNGMGPASKAKEKDRHKKASNMNMQGVFLHILGDALGSVIVVISAAVVQWTSWQYKHYLDPVLSIVMSLIIIRSTWPLLIESAMVLLQTVPTHIDVQEIEKKLLAIEGVQGVHEFHVWRLTGDRIIASAHITFHSMADYMRIAGRVKRVFHDEGIHSTTIQPEALDIQNNGNTLVQNADKLCTVNCPSENDCATNTCCPPPKIADDR
ncbi:unnamed protein product [Notodromas monacha]|uniref:Solute carrier family 30 member 1 n=1 Tax=Notodromas monacha TaxID=399045 RepID=A0A7R9GE14_9CRUS|nr:unnamed protein product [Notodromas monacha]CAG0917554.1 unnamed protein product [Notodromas monacha]